MKHWTVIALLFPFCFFLNAQESDFKWEKDLIKGKGKVTVLEDKETWIIIPDNNPNGRFISQQLPEEFKKEGLKISFSGWRGIIPPNFRMLGTPLKLKCICITKSEQEKFGLKKRSCVFK